MPPKKVYQGTVGVWLFVSMLVMAAVYGNPAGGSVLQATESEDGERMFQPFGTSKTAVREQAMVTQVDAEDAENIITQDSKQYPGPAEEPREKRQTRNQMIDGYQDSRRPEDAARRNAVREGKLAPQGCVKAGVHEVASRFHDPRFGGEGRPGSEYYPSAPTILSTIRQRFPRHRRVIHRFMPITKRRRE